MRLTRRTLILLIAAASLLMHLKGIGSPLLDYHHHRQANTAAIARNYHRNGLHFLKPQIDWQGDYRGRAATEFPLTMWLTGLLWPLGGLGELWGRLLSVLFSALTAVYLFLFLETEMEREAAFYGGVLFSCLPLEIYFGRTVQPEAFALFAGMASLFHWNRFLKDRGRLHWLAAALFAFLSISHKLPYAYLLLPLAALAWIRLGPSALSSPGVWLAFPMVAAGVFAWYRYASSGVYVVPSHAGEFWSLLQYRRLPFFVQFQFLSRYPELSATYAGVALVLLGARELILRRGQAFYAAWFASICLYIVLGGGYAFHHEYTSLPFIPVNAALMGMGLYRLKSAVSRVRPAARGWAWAGLALLVLAVPAHAMLRVRHWYALNFPFLARAEKAAQKVSAPDDLFVCHQRASSVYLFYLDRKGWSWDLAEAGESRIGEVEEKIREGAKFFMAAKEGIFKDREGFYARWFYSRFPLVYDQDGMLIFKLRTLR